MAACEVEAKGRGGRIVNAGGTPVSHWFINLSGVEDLRRAAHTAAAPIA
jgi:hypothetical protein